MGLEGLNEWEFHTIIRTIPESPGEVAKRSDVLNRSRSLSLSPPLPGALPKTWADYFLFRAHLAASRRHDIQVGSAPSRPRVAVYSIYARAPRKFHRRRPMNYSGKISAPTALRGARHFPRRFSYRAFSSLTARFSPSHLPPSRSIPRIELALSGSCYSRSFRREIAGRVRAIRRSFSLHERAYTLILNPFVSPRSTR